PNFWPYLFSQGFEICFAYTTFEWANNAAHNAVADAVIVGITRNCGAIRHLYTGDEVRACGYISPYLIPDIRVIVEKASVVLSSLPPMVYGSKPIDGGNLTLTRRERDELVKQSPSTARFVKRLYGSEELIHDVPRYCLYIDDADLEEASSSAAIAKR